jgi:peptide/nickel transport system ATP-binding protein
MSAGAQPVLSVRGLTISRGPLQLVSDVSFSLAPGERLGIIGESGSGKTLTALAAMGLLPASLTAAGQVLVKGQDLLSMAERDRCDYRGSAISMVFQEPMTALNPTMRVGKQIAEAIRAHRRGSAAHARSRAIELLERVEFTDPARQARAYPHQLSGGQRQRVMLAMAIACDPAVILADEPTTALDVTVQEQVLALMSRLVAEEDSALVLISHDLAIVSGLCERIVVMYGGRVAEAGTTRQVLTAPCHPYTAALIATSGALTLDSDRSRAVLPSIRGQVPSAGTFPAGCPFRTRCERATQACESVPELLPAGGDDHQVACFHPVGVPAAISPGDAAPSGDTAPVPSSPYPPQEDAR